MALIAPEHTVAGPVFDPEPLPIPDVAAIASVAAVAVCAIDIDEAKVNVVLAAHSIDLSSNEDCCINSPMKIVVARHPALRSIGIVSVITFLDLTALFAVVCFEAC